LDCTPILNSPDPLALLAASGARPPATVLTAQRQPTTTADIPPGDNVLRNGRATLKLGGTKGWMSQGAVQVVPAELTNGRVDDVDKPWLHLNEVFWDGTAGRQVWAEITFAEPTDVKALTVHENPKYRESWPTEGVVQVWDEGEKRWQTAAFGVFLRGPTNTYRLDLNAVRKLRYLPWQSYFRNFYTSEIEVH
jgi:hypothetical protein